MRYAGEPTELMQRMRRALSSSGRLSLLQSPSLLPSSLPRCGAALCPPSSPISFWNSRSYIPPSLRQVDASHHWCAVVTSSVLPCRCAAAAAAVSGVRGE